MTITEIEARLSAIASECESATGDALAALESEAAELTEQRSSLMNEVERRQNLRNNIAAGAGTPAVVAAPQVNTEERAAQEFVQSRSMTVGSEQARSVLVSGGTLARPTAVHGINDIPEAKYSSILDFIRVVNCTGMGTNRVAYIAADTDAASDQTEGSAATAAEPTFSYVDIVPTSVAVTAQISKQAKKQTPLNYKGKVQEQAFIALRKRAAAIVTAKLKASNLNRKVNATIASGKGVVDAKTLRTIVLNYGGDEGVGSGVLFLNKTDLLAFGDVRGTNEKKAVYEIIPDANPNTGIIRDGGMSVRYCINSGLTACHDTAQGAADKITMIYGDPMCLEMDLFSDYEIRVSEDFAFTSLMDTIRGDVELGADVIAKNGFVAYTIAHS